MSVARSSEAIPRTLWLAVRPWQWLKNLVCVAPAVFALRFGDAALWSGIVRVTIAFCLVSSAGYLVNDLVDRAEDRNHSRKRRRPIASGQLRPARAAVFALLLALVGFAVVLLGEHPGDHSGDHSGLLGGLLGGYAAAAAPWLGAYAALSLAYTFVLRRLVFLDVAAIATGFAFRVLAGGAAAQVPVSRWLLLCTLTGAALVALGKRASELGRDPAGPESPESLENRAPGRPVLVQYRALPLQRSLYAFAAVVIVAYAGYTVAPRTVAAFGGYGLVLSAPFVGLAVLRYVFLVKTSPLAEDPAIAFLKDPWMAGLAVAWGLVIGWVVSAAP